MTDPAKASSCSPLVESTSIGSMHSPEDDFRRAGRLGGPVLEESGRQFQAGDRVMLRRNDARLNVCNGQTGAVAPVDVPQGSLIVVLDDGTCRPVPHASTARPKVSHHGYATTIHKAQGLTVDRCLVLADELIYREAAYVALSRGRARDQLYVVDTTADVEHEAHGTDMATRPRLRRSRPPSQPVDPSRSRSTSYPGVDPRNGTCPRSRWRSNCDVVTVRGRRAAHAADLAERFVNTGGASTRKGAE